MRFLFILFIALNVNAHAGDTAKLYNPYANVEKDINAALLRAKKEKKHVLIQIGGNWCVWCYKFHSFIFTDSVLKHILENNYILYHLNYSKENRNASYLKKLGYPQRFGFPALVILDSDGNRLHTQDSGLLEKGNGYDEEKVKSFLLNWSPTVFDEKLYE